MTVIAATWVPGFEVHESPAGDAGPYTGGPIKLVWHTSETDPGSIDAVAGHLDEKRGTDVYHILADTRLRRVVQVLPLNKAASALRHPPGVETNHDGAVQVCIIGWAHFMAQLGASDLAWLGKAVLAPIKRALDSDAAGDTLNLDQSVTFYGDDAGFTLASSTARQRMGSAQWDAFNGQCGHQHVPGNDHWDPGKLNVAAITEAAHVALKTKPAPAPAPAPAGPRAHPVLRRGSHGAAVLELQRKMRFGCGQVIYLDGVFGPQTEHAVKTVQTFFKLEVDGIAGPHTWGIVDYCAAVRGVR